MNYGADLTKRHKVVLGRFKKIKALTKGREAMALTREKMLVVDVIT
jgi:hypothetical protein